MQIRRLNEQDYEMVMNFVTREPEYNLFIIGDIENYGFKQDFQDVFGAFGDAGELFGVLLRYYENWIVYAVREEALAEFASLIEKRKPGVISAKHETACLLLKYLKNLRVKKRRSMHLARLRALHPDLKVDTADVLRATVDNVDEIVELRSQIEEMDLPTNRNSILRNIREGSGRTYFMRRDGKMVSMASSTAENPYSAMIVGVATLREYRGRGLASACVYRLCADLLGEGKTPCLFYDNPAAGRIYHRIGFEDIGKWDVIVMDG